MPVAGRASSADRAAVNAEPADGKTAAPCCFFLASVAPGNAVIAAAGVANATCLAVAGRVVATAACGAAVATAGGAALGAGRAAVAAAGVVYKFFVV